jgi:hypothetical protein
LTAGGSDRISGVTGTQEVEQAAQQGVSRPPLLGQAAASALLGGLLVALAFLDDRALLGGVALVQLLTVLGFLAVSDAPASGGIFLLGAVGAVAADVIVLVDDGQVRYLGGVVALSLVLGLLHQLSRKERSRVTESLADTLVVAALVSAAACLAAAVQLDGGQWPTRTALVAAAVALTAGRLGDAVIHRPALAIGSTRAWPGLILALGAGVAAAAIVADGHLSTSKAALVGLSAAAAVAAVDLFVDLAAAELTAVDARRVAALRPTALVLPFALLGPVALVAVRVIGHSS